MSPRLFWALFGTATVALLVTALQTGAGLGGIAIGIGVALVLARVLTWVLERSVHRSVSFTGMLLQGGRPQRLPEDEGGIFGDLYRSLNRLAEKHRGQTKQLGTEKAETETLLQEMGEGILALDGAGIIARSNAVLRELVGATEPLVGKSPATVFRDPTLVRFLSAESDDGSRHGEFEVFGRTMLVTARRLPTGGTVAVFSDLTPLRRLGAVRTEFVANASHELKTPLTAIRG